MSHRTIGEVARLTGLSVRALHHYDAIGLVTPRHRSGGGYRLYGDDELRRLHEVLLLRELGFTLEEVGRLLDADPGARRQALLRQREHLQRQQAHARAVLEALDATLLSLDTGRPMNTEHLFQGYAQFENGEYAREAEQRWGDTDAWRESRRRTARYRREDWQTIQAEAEAITLRFAEAMHAGEPAEGATGAELAEAHRRHIDRWYYPCSRAMHARVASLYTADPRYAEAYDRHAPGLAAYVQAAIVARSRRPDL